MSDDFFNSFGDSPQAPRPTVRHRGGPPPGPPPPNRGPPRAAAAAAPPPQARPPPPQQQQQQQQQQQRRAAPPPQQQQQQQKQRRPVVAPPPNQNSYVLSGSSNHSAGGSSRNPPPPPAGSAGASMRNGGSSSRTSRGSVRAPQAAAPQQSYYSAQQQQPPQQQQQTPSPAPSEASAPPPGYPQYETSNDDWYSPTASETGMQPSPAYAAAAPAAYNNSINYPAQQPQQQYSSGTAPAYSSNNINTQSAYSLQGSMDLSGRSAGSTGSVGMMMNLIKDPNVHTFVPQVGSKTAAGDFEDFDNEPPLLEELGVNLEHILLKTKAVVVPFRRFHKGNSALTDPALIIEDADLAGPLFLALLLGGELMMSGKLQFGYIYGFGMFGCLAMTVILNLMSPEKAISFWTVMSILGYALVPVNLLAAIKLLFVFYLQGLTKLLAVVAVLWSTTASTRLLELGCGLQAQRYLLAYPIALLYSAFVLITIF